MNDLANGGAVQLFPRCAYTPIFENQSTPTVSGLPQKPSDCSGGLAIVVTQDVIVQTVGHFYPNFFKSRSAATTAFEVWVSLHVVMFATLQRLGMIESRILPWPSFFVPFTSRSLLGAPLPPLASLTARKALWWLADVALSLVPMVAFYNVKYCMGRIEGFLFELIAPGLPNMTRTKAFGELGGNGQPSTTQPPSAPSTPSMPSQRGQRTASPAISPAAPTATSDDPSHRRHASVTTTQPPNSTEDFHGTDDEADNAVSTGVIISFDIEHTEAPESPPTNPYAAEWRPAAATMTSIGGQSPSAPGIGAGTSSENGNGNGNGTSATTTTAITTVPEYHSTQLTRLPHSVGASMISTAVATFILMPWEAVLVRLVARSWATRMGVGIAGTYGLFEVGRLGSAKGMVNLVGLSALRLLVNFVVWGGVAAAAEWWYIDEETWAERRRARQTVVQEVVQEAVQPYGVQEDVQREVD